VDGAYLMVFAQLLGEASLQRIDDVRRDFGEIGENIPGGRAHPELRCQTRALGGKCFANGSA
jgi:hypothetical protein